MENTFRRRVAVMLLSLSFATPVVAGELASYSFEKCRTQKECRLVSQTELGQLRGGFSLSTAGGSIEMSFGIVQAVFINNQLVALTQLLGPGAGQVITLAPSAAQMQALNAALQGRASAVPLASFNASGAGAPATSLSAAQSASPAPAAATNPTGTAPAALTQGASTAGFNGSQNAAQTLATAPPTTGFNGTPSGPNAASVQPASGAVSASGSSVSTASIAPATPTVSVNGTAVTPGNPVINVPTATGIRTVVIQNGPGNIALPSAADIRNGTMATVIQNTVDGQTIRAATLMNVSLGLSKAMTAMALQRAVSQGMATTGR
jgi:hypothetical protein